MAYIRGLECVKCERHYSPEEVDYTCPVCGREGILNVLYDYEVIKEKLTKEYLEKSQEFSHWRYLPLLPIENPEYIQPLRVGWTPLFRAPRLEEELDLRFLYLKDDGQNPTASLKDRASSIGVVKAMEKGAKVITCASTGNAASSLAGYAAAAGLESYIFVPEKAPQAKIAQLLIFGSHVLLVRGSYDQAHDLCEMAVEEWGWYNRNCAVNPYLVEGKKTAGLEICEQLDWVPPDKVFVSVGDGCTISGIWKGFKEFHHLGLIKNLPQMIGIQAEGCQPIKKAFETFSPLEPVNPNTIADSIAVGVPRNWIKALKSVRESDGFFVSVTDEEILEAMKKLAKRSGIFGEPAGVAGFAGLLKLLREGKVDKEERILVMVTGNGLKDVESALKAGGSCLYVEPSLEDLKKTLEEGNGN